MKTVSSSVVPLRELNMPVVETRRGRPVDDRWFPLMVAWRPMYVERYGNVSHVYLSDGRELCYVHTSAQTARDVYRYYQLDVAACRAFYRQITGRSQTPLIVIPGLDRVYMPIKTRCGADLKVRTDGVTGYVAIGDLTQCDEIQGERWAKPALRLEVKNRFTLNVQMSTDRLWSHMADAMNLMAAYQARQETSGTIRTCLDILTKLSQ